MEANRVEALKAKEIAEKRFASRDFAGAMSYALKAKSLYPELEGISQMLATFEVYIASQVKRNGEICYYSILGLKPSAGKREVKKQYKMMAVLLHPDKNKCIGADGAFRLISEAWNFLSDEFKKSTFYYKRKKHIDSMVLQTNSSGSGCYPSVPPERPDTFWTVCNSCKVQYEYLRKYVNKRLSCKNCRGTFIAVETGAAPISDSFHYEHSSSMSSNGYGCHGYDGVTCIPANSPYYMGHYSGHRYEYVTNASNEWSSYSVTSSCNLDTNGLSTISSDYAYQVRNGSVRRGRPKIKHGPNGTCLMKSVASNVTHSNISEGFGESSATKAGRPEKKRKFVVGANYGNGYDENGSKSALESGAGNTNANIEQDIKLLGQSHISSRRWSAAPAFDARKLLIGKARAHVQKRLEEMSLASESAAAVEGNRNASDERVSKNGNWVLAAHESERNKHGPVSISVPDSDFHDFDQDRSEECFKPKQIWAIYDEDDGMPRLYCLIREVVSVQPFKVNVTYLSSRTDTEFGWVNWVDSGFTKSCGHFRARNTDIIEQVNIFSHLLKGEKTGRGGCVRIFPKTGDIWAVYRNWSPDWDRSTPDEVRHQYDMVEIIEDYSEELGVCVNPLIKLEGFKTVYQRNPSKDAMRWIPRREMLRFSHQVPSWLLNEEHNLPSNCWDLDPAATPEELLNGGAETN